MLPLLKQISFSAKTKFQEIAVFFPKNKTFFVKPKPIYINQLSDAEKKKIEKFYGKIKDKEAVKKFGARDIKEFSFWAWRSCGIVCIQMILRSRKKTMELIKEALKENGYIFKKDIGWRHKALVKIAQKNKFDAKILKMLTPFDIAKNIQDKKYVILSIKSPTGGHMILIFGFETNSKGKIKRFFYYDPLKRQKSRLPDITPEKLQKKSKGYGIAVWKMQ
jgi:hypothetical protein